MFPPPLHITGDALRGSDVISIPISPLLDNPIMNRRHGIILLDLLADPELIPCRQCWRVQVRFVRIYIPVHSGVQHPPD